MRLLLILLIFTCCNSKAPTRYRTIVIDTIATDSVRRTITDTWESERAMHEYYKQMNSELLEIPYTARSVRKIVDKSRTYVYTNSRNKNAVVASTNAEVSRIKKQSDNAGNAMVGDKTRQETKNVQGNYVEETMPRSGFSFSLPGWVWVVGIVVVLGFAFIFFKTK